MIKKNSIKIKEMLNMMLINSLMDWTIIALPPDITFRGFLDYLMISKDRLMIKL